MHWIDDGLPMPAARPIDRDEALDACAGVLIALSGAIAGTQAFMAFALDRPVEVAVHVALLLPMATQAAVPVRSRARGRLQLASGWCAAAVWLVLIPAGDPSAAPIAMAMAAVTVLVVRALTGGRPAGRGSWPQTSDALVAGSPAPAGNSWIEDDVEGVLPAR